ncbi:MAG: DUF1819 family protein [Ruoffia tabacinasalis]
MVNKLKYTFSFTGASALINETLIIAEEYAKLKDWKLVQASLVENNYLNKIKLNTLKREFAEIKKRLINLSSSQLTLILDGSLDDAKAMILLAMAKTYAYLRDFIVEVLYNKYLVFDTVLTEVDYMKFYNVKCQSHPELNEITETTDKKVKQVIFKLLEQVGLITQAKNGTIIKPILSQEAISVIVEDDLVFLPIFLYSREEIKTFK